MEIIYYLFAAALVVIAIQAAIAIWSPRMTWIRISAVVITALFIPIGYVTLTQILSKPKPIAFTWFETNVNRALVLGVSFDEGKAIYLWLRLEGSKAPSYYVLPWRQKDAELLEDTLHAAINKRAKVVMTRPFSRKNYMELGTLSVEIMPPPSLPMKPPRIPPQVFNPRSTDI